MKNRTNKEKFILFWAFLKGELIVVGVIVLIMIFRVLISEQSLDGKSASRVVCYEYEGCEIIKKSLGKRLTEEIKFAVVAGALGLGLLVGGICYERKKVELSKREV